MRAAGLEAGAGEAFTAERLAAGHGADLVAVDVEVADADSLHPVIDVRLDAAVNAQGEAVAGALDVVDHFVPLIVTPGGDVQQRPENFFFRQVFPVHQRRFRRHVESLCAKSRVDFRRDRAPASVAAQPGAGLFQLIAGAGVDDRPHVAGQQGGMPHFQRRHGAFELGQQAVKQGVLHQQHPQGGAALTGAGAGAGQHIPYQLLRQSGAVGDEDIESACNPPEK